MIDLPVNVVGIFYNRTIYYVSISFSGSLCFITLCFARQHSPSAGIAVPATFGQFLHIIFGRQV